MSRKEKIRENERPLDVIFTNERLKKGRPVNASLIIYDTTKTTEKKLDDIAHIKELIQESGQKWLNIDGIHDGDVIESIGLQLGVHILVLEDILDSDQRPKADDFGSYLFVVLKMIYLDPSARTILIEQVSFLLFENLVITVQEEPEDVFGSIRKKLLQSIGKLRKSRSDYLFYNLIDVIVDNYFLIIEAVEEDMARLERQTLHNPDEKVLEYISITKSNIMELKLAIAPVTDIVRFLKKGECELVSETLAPYFSDIYDNVLRCMTSVHTLEERIDGVLDIYMSSMSNDMNKIMKVLTAVSTIFIPLTFISSVYGMNFKFMPELESPVGYYIVLGIMASIGLGLLIFFRRKKWL